MIYNNNKKLEIAEYKDYIPEKFLLTFCVIIRNMVCKLQKLKFFIAVLARI